jgi:hypothetical protein
VLWLISFLLAVKKRERERFGRDEKGSEEIVKISHFSVQALN